MHPDFRRTTFANLELIEKNIGRLRVAENRKTKDGLLVAIRTSIQLLHNDLTMVLNQNFYLQCRLLQKERLLAQLEKRYCQLQENSKLNLHMTKARYQKHIHHIKYEHFAQGISKKQDPCYGQISKCYDFSPFREELLTAKKTLTLKDTHSALDHKETLSKPKTSKEEFNDIQVDKRYDLQVRLEGVMSEQIANKTPNFMKQAAKSDVVENGRRKKRGGSQQLRQQKKPLELEKEGKRQELARLVAQQFKVPPIKQQYFSTDML